MVKIRLRRMGAKKNPYYRIIVADSRAPRDGRFIEEIGTYNPLTSPSLISVDLERANYWIKNGAQPTDTVKALLKKSGASISESKPKSAGKTVGKAKPEVQKAEPKPKAAKPKEEKPVEEVKEEPKKEAKEEVVEEKPAKKAKEEAKEEPVEEKPVDEAKEEPVEEPADE